MKYLIEAVKNGDELDMLITLRETLARDIDACESGRDMASLSKQFVDVSERIRELQSLKPKERNTPLDRVKKKNKAPAKR